MGRYFKCFTDKNPVSYALGEEITFTVFARENGSNIGCERVEWVLRGDDGGIAKGTAKISETMPLTVKYTLKRAGFVHLNCVAFEENGQKADDFEPLDSSAGVNVLSLEYSDTLPYDFEEYWSEIEELVEAFETEVIFFREENIRQGFKTYEVRIKTPSGRPASGYISIPEREGEFPIRISFVGYGIHAAYYEFDENKICGCFNAHGFENDKSDSELEAIYGKELVSYGFDKNENASPRTAYYRNMMIRDLLALKYMKTIPSWNKRDILSAGGSQGGLQAITVAAHDRDVTEVIALKPWFCDLNSVNEGYLCGWRPDYAEGLRYFDTVAQAMFVRCPVTIECYLGDYVCPPKTVMALYNTIKTPKRISFVQSARHSYFPPENEEVSPVFAEI